MPSDNIPLDKAPVRLDGHGVCEILDGILRLFPLDTYVDAPVALMAVQTATTEALSEFPMNPATQTKND